MSNEFGITWDHPGFCALCHTQIAEFNGFNPNLTPVITKLLPTFNLIPFLLNDGSVMNVALDTQCVETLQPEDAQLVMESCIRGWQYEVDHRLPGWDEDRKTSHMDAYRRKYIKDRADVQWTDEEKKLIKLPRKEQMVITAKPTSRPPHRKKP